MSVGQANVEKFNEDDDEWVELSILIDSENEWTMTHADIHFAEDKGDFPS